MDNSNIQEQNLKVLRRHNRDGTITYRKVPDKPVKVVIARGKGEHTIGAVIVSRLLPFRKAMKMELQRRGFNTSGMNFRNVIALYYNEVISQKYDKSSPYVPIDAKDFVNSFVFKVSPKDDYNADLSDIHNVTDINRVDSVIDNIIDVFRASKLKKQFAHLQGTDPKQVLTSEELLQANAAEKVQRVLENKEMNVKPVSTGQIKNILFISLIGLLLYTLLK
jgi:hypothetical protein